MITIHECCGCSCDVCENGHRIGCHTQDCIDLFYEMNPDLNG